MVKKKTKEDIKYVKKNPEVGILLSHPGMTHYDAEKLVNEPEKIIDVSYSKSHEDRLVIVKKFSKKHNTVYIILNPFNPKISEEFKDKVAVVTFYPVKQ